MASINSTSSLGNTSLRGYGGMASGIDRDAIIEKMTLGTTTKISNQKKQVTELQWKQEAYRSISDKIIDWSDTYASYASDKNLKDPTVFSRNQISVHGKEDSKGLVSVNGSSDLIDSLSILAVNQTATSAVRQSQRQESDGGRLQMDMGNLSDTTYTPVLGAGAKLIFESTSTDSQGKPLSTVEFTLKDKYKDGDGDDAKDITVNYAPQTKEEYEQLVKDLNAQLKQSEVKMGERNLSDEIEFMYEEGADGPYIKIKTKEKTDDQTGSTEAKNYQLKGNYASKAFGYGDGNVKLSEISDPSKVSQTSFSKSGMTSKTTLDVIKGEKVTFTYNGSSKSLVLITNDEANAIKGMKISDVYKTTEEQDAIKAAYGLDGDAKLSDLQNAMSQKLKDTDNSLTDTAKEALKADLAKIGEAQLEKVDLQSRLNQAFGEVDGKGVVKVGITGGQLSFDTKDDDAGPNDPSATISITSSNGTLLKTLGVEYGASNKINLNGKLSQDSLNLGDLDDYKLKDEEGNVTEELDLVINGVQIKGLTEKSSINDIISKINSTKETGVKATYVDATGQFMLVATESGKGRKITLGTLNADKTENKDSLAWKLFGGDEAKGAKSEDGQNAQVVVSYGQGTNITLERSSNTFNLEGLNVTVSGTFGKKDEKGDWMTSEGVTFSAKADVDGAVEKVKQFIEDYNALVTEIDSQVRTRPDSSYGALTDEQKAEMDETSIENWEKKAKQGLLYGDSIMRDLSMDVQSVFTKMLNNGASYEDLNEIGITYADDWGDGGTLVFDEAKFKAAMETDPDKVSNIFTGGGNVKKGLIDTIEETFTPYATRYANKNRASGGKGSYGRLIEMAGSEKKPSTVIDNEIYKQLKEMQETIDKLQDQLKIEQDRYISQFTTMETLLNQMNTQSSYLSQLSA